MGLRYTDLGDLKEYLGVKGADKDPLLERILRGVETFAETYTHRRFAPDPPLAEDGADTNAPVPRVLRLAPGDSEIRVPDLREVESVSLSSPLSPGAAVTLYELEGGWPDKPATHLRLPAVSRSYVQQTATIVGRWGWNPVPADLLDAVYTHASRRWKERDASYADVVTTELGTQLSYFRTMPSNVKGVYDSYRVRLFALVP